MPDAVARVCFLLNGGGTAKPLALRLNASLILFICILMRLWRYLPHFSSSFLVIINYDIFVLLQLA